MYGLNKENNQKDEVIFEFYLLSYTKIIEQLQLNISIKAGDPSQEFDHTLTMDLDHLWVAALKILQLFEETVSSSYPSIYFFNYGEGGKGILILLTKNNLNKYAGMDKKKKKL